MMNRFSVIFTLILTLFTVLGCNKDESTLNDYDLFGRLQSGSGTWRVISISTKDNSVANSPEEMQTTSEQFIHFYIRTQFIGNVTADAPVATFYINGNRGATTDVEAEKERVVLRLQSQIFGGNSWTVIKNRLGSQEWHSTSGNITTIMKLEKCKCEIPTIPGIEQGG